MVKPKVYFVILFVTAWIVCILHRRHEVNVETGVKKVVLRMCQALGG